MRVTRRFVGDAVSAQVFLRRNAGTVPGKRFSARARLTLSQGEILGFCANAQLNVAVRKLGQPGAYAEEAACRRGAPYQ
jgi:hypothetical protein